MSSVDWNNLTEGVMTSITIEFLFIYLFGHWFIDFPWQVLAACDLQRDVAQPNRGRYDLNYHSTIYTFLFIVPGISAAYE